jgi:hypothetical protein
VGEMTPAETLERRALLSLLHEARDQLKAHGACYMANGRDCRTCGADYFGYWMLMALGRSPCSEADYGKHQPDCAIVRLMAELDAVLGVSK